MAALRERRDKLLPFPLHQRKVLARMRFEEKLTVRFYEEIENEDFQA